MAPIKSKKINGLSFVASPNHVSEKHIMPVVNINANYTAIMPFGFIRDLEHPEIIHNTDRQWFGETRAGAKQYIEALKKKHNKIMIKPQIWVWRAEFTGYIEMNTEENWKLLEESYSSFILEYADLAEELKVEILCIGTELEKFIENRPEYWNRLIKEIRTIYSGKITYAANWDEYKRVPFLTELDYIGVDAYFPVSENETPSLEESKNGWNKWKKEMKELSARMNKKIIFTEFGYRSVNFSGKEPWKSDRDMNIVNLDAQINTTQALFEEIWGEDWFAGGFLWKWFINHTDVGGSNNSMFTPQNKPVEAIIESYYNEQE
jgi:hypothetical protein